MSVQTLLKKLWIFVNFSERVEVFTKNGSVSVVIWQRLPELQLVVKQEKTNFK